MKDIPIISFQHDSLSTIDISSNQITKWKTIHSLSQLAHLHHLYISNNDLLLDDLTFDFPFVRFVDLNHLHIQTIQELESVLSHFPSLTELEIRDNPIYSQGQGDHGDHGGQEEGDINVITREVVLLSNE